MKVLNPKGKVAQPISKPQSSPIDYHEGANGKLLDAAGIGGKAFDSVRCVNSGAGKPAGKRRPGKAKPKAKPKRKAKRKAKPKPKYKAKPKYKYKYKAKPKRKAAQALLQAKATLKVAISKIEAKSMSKARFLR